MEIHWSKCVRTLFFSSLLYPPPPPFHTFSFFLFFFCHDFPTWALTAPSGFKWARRVPSPPFGATVRRPQLNLVRSHTHTSRRYGYLSSSLWNNRHSFLVKPGFTVVRCFTWLWFLFTVNTFPSRTNGSKSQTYSFRWQIGRRDMLKEAFRDRLTTWTS